MSTFTEATQPVTPDAILQLGFAWWGSKTLLSAVELGLFSELAASGSLDADEMRARLLLHPRGARDFLDALVALGLLERNNGCYRKGNEAVHTSFANITVPALALSIVLLIAATVAASRKDGGR